MRHVDSTFECVGMGETANQGIVFTRKDEIVVRLGVSEEDAPIKIELVQDKEIKMIGDAHVHRAD